MLEETKEDSLKVFSSKKPFGWSRHKKSKDKSPSHEAFLSSLRELHIYNETLFTIAYSLCALLRK